MKTFTQQIYNGLTRAREKEATPMPNRSRRKARVPGDNGKPVNQSLRLYYATTRQPDTGSDELFTASRERSAPFHFGEIGLPIPAEFDELEFERSYNQWATNQSESLRIQAQSDSSMAQYKRALNSLSGDTLVYIHGYNMDFKEAVHSAVQWAAGAGYKGNLILYSWPSHSRITEYAGDRETAVWSSKGLSILLRMLAKHRKHRIHLLAHSMGSVVLTSALQMVANLRATVFENIILAAPDLDAELFTDVLWPMQQHLARRWSVYYSAADLALLVSEKLNTNTRLGSAPLTIQGIDFIDASSSNFSYAAILDSHTYHDRKPGVVRDILQLIKGKPPVHRQLCKKRDKANFVWHLQAPA